MVAVKERLWEVGKCEGQCVRDKENKRKGDSAQESRSKRERERDRGRERGMGEGWAERPG